MTEHWATIGLDLHLELTGSRLRASLESALREAARSGRLPAGTKLPSSRALSHDLGIARNTVAEAYGQLTAEGWLATRHGGGTWVAERTTGPPADAEPVPGPGRPARYDLRAGRPDVGAFPRAAWLAAYRRALQAAPSEAFGYTDPRGLPELRSALAGYLGRTRGVYAAPERIVVCAGYAQGLELLAGAIRAAGGTRLAAEAFGHRMHWGIAASTGLRLHMLAVDEHGADISALGNADAALLTPAHQFPLGVPLAPGRRRLAADWATRNGGVIIEDDYDGELRYDRQAVGALQALAPEHVVYAGTASKSLAPGLRLGWLVLPARMVADVVAAKEAAGQLSSSLDQLALAELISSGGYDRQVRRMRLAYRRRRDKLTEALGRHAPQVRVTGISAGLQALLRLPAGQDEDQIVARAGRHGLAVDGLRHYTADGFQVGQALVIGYATPPAHAYSTALARLCAVLTADSTFDGQRGI